MKSQKGFTVIEMIVVIALSIFFTTIAIVYSGTSRKYISFLNQQSLLIGSFFKARAYAVETFQPTQTPFDATPPNEKICGWGLHLEKGIGATPDNYVIYRDFETLGASDPCADSAAGNYDANTGEDFEMIALDPALIKFKCLDLVDAPDTGCATNAGLPAIDVFFQPPDPKVKFYGQSGTPAEADIVLQLADNSRCSLVTVNKAGQVNVKDLPNCN